MTSLKINDGGAAFPYGQKNHTERSSEGMSLRDWFAGQAMTAIIGILHCAPDTFKEVSGRAYTMADAMIAAREKIK